MYKKLLFSWDRYPALFLLFSCLSGAMLYLAMPIPLLLSLTHKKHSFKIGYIFLSFFTAILFSLNEGDIPNKIEENVTAFIKPQQLKQSRGQFFLKAHCPYLKTQDGKEVKNLKLFVPVSKKITPSLDHHYIVSGTLKKTPYGYFLKGKNWTKSLKSFSPILKRFHLHQKVKKIIKKQVKDKEVISYFSSLVTGDIADPFLRAKFLENGVLHTLAISGFHFSWIIFLLSIPISLIFPKKTTLLLLLFFSWGYFFFLGSSPSIERAWIAISIYILSILFSKNPLPLNALGLAGLISFLIYPYSAFELSFSLSFLATFAILTLHPLIQYIINKICHKRSKDMILIMPIIDRIAYHLLRFFLASLTLSILIQVALLPLFIHFFPFISLWGLLYNIFIPLTMIPTLILLLLSFMLHPIINSTFLWRLCELFSKPFLETILYGKGGLLLLIKTPLWSPQILSLATCLILFFCLKIEAHFYEEYLNLQDDYLLT